MEGWFQLANTFVIRCPRCMGIQLRPCVMKPSIAAGINCYVHSGFMSETHICGHPEMSLVLGEQVLKTGDARYLQAQVCVVVKAWSWSGVKVEFNDPRTRYGDRGLTCSGRNFEASNAKGSKARQRSNCMRMAGVLASQGSCDRADGQRQGWRLGQVGGKKSMMR